MGGWTSPRGGQNGLGDVGLGYVGDGGGGGGGDGDDGGGDGDNDTMKEGRRNMIQLFIRFIFIAHFIKSLALADTSRTQTCP